jgi:hypothetical protein
MTLIRPKRDVAEKRKSSGKINNSRRIKHRTSVYYTTEKTNHMKILTLLILLFSIVPANAQLFENESKAKQHFIVLIVLTLWF